MAMKKERDFEVAIGTQDEFWIQAVDLLQAKFVLERFVLKSLYCCSKCFLIFCRAQPSNKFLIKGTNNHANEKFYTKKVSHTYKTIT